MVSSIHILGCLVIAVVVFISGSDSIVPARSVDASAKNPLPGSVAVSSGA
jgi:hypothetical protein